jgi:hypothetical protein
MPFLLALLHKKIQTPTNGKRVAVLINSSGDLSIKI